MTGQYVCVSWFTEKQSIEGYDLVVMGNREEPTCCSLQLVSGSSCYVPWTDIIVLLMPTPRLGRVQPCYKKTGEQRLEVQGVTIASAVLANIADRFLDMNLQLLQDTAGMKHPHLEGFLKRGRNKREP